MLDFFADPINRIKSYNSSSRESAYLMLKEKRATYLLDYQIATLGNININQYTDMKSYDIWSKPLYFVFSKNTPNLDELKTKIDNYLEKINASRNSKCLNKYLQPWGSFLTTTALRRYSAFYIHLTWVFFGGGQGVNPKCAGFIGHFFQTCSLINKWQFSPEEWVL